MIEIKQNDRLYEIKNNKIINLFKLKKRYKSNTYQYKELYINNTYVKTFPNFITHESPVYYTLNNNFLNIQNDEEHVIGIEGFIYKDQFELNIDNYKVFDGYFFTPAKFKNTPTPSDFFEIIKIGGEYVLYNELDLIGEYRIIHLYGYNLIFPKKVLSYQFVPDVEFYILVDVYSLYDFNNDFLGVEILKEFPKPYNQTNILDYFKEKYFYDENDVEDLIMVKSGGGFSNYFIINKTPSSSVFFGTKNNLYEINIPKGVLNVYDDFSISKINKNDYNQSISYYYYDLIGNNYSIPVNISTKNNIDFFNNCDLYLLFDSLFNRKNIFFYVSSITSDDFNDVKKNIFYIKKINYQNFKLLTDYLSFFDIDLNSILDDVLIEYNNNIYVHHIDNVNNDIIFPFSIKKINTEFLYELDEEDIFVYKDLKLCKYKDSIFNLSDNHNIKKITILNDGNNYNDGIYVLEKFGLKLIVNVELSKIKSVTLLDSNILYKNFSITHDDFPNEMKNSLSSGGEILIEVYDPYYKRKYHKTSNAYISTYLNISGAVFNNLQNYSLGLITDLRTKNNNLLNVDNINYWDKMSGKIITNNILINYQLVSSINYLIRFIFKIK